MKLYLKMRTRTRPQKIISESQKRFNVAVWGRQSGKTTIGIDKMLIKPLMGRPGGIYWYVLQTYSAATVAYTRYKNDALKNPVILRKKPHDSGLYIPLINNVTVFFKSGDNYEDLRSETLDGAIIDEYSLQNKDLWPMIIRPMLNRRKGWCDFYSTPKGFDHFYDLYNHALDHPQEWGAFHAPSTEAPWNTPEEMISARATMTEDEYAQEYLAEFREFGVGKAYRNHNPMNQSVQNPFAITGEQWSPYIPIIVGLDFNVGLMSWELCQYKTGYFHYGDEIAVKNTDTQEMSLLLAEKVKDHKPGVILIGDSTGNARKTSAVGKTDYTIIENTLKSKGIRFENKTPKENPLVKDRINMVNARLMAADGSVHLTYNPVKCPYLKKDFERVNVKQGTNGFALDKKDPMLTQASDAAGYPICYYSDEWRYKPGVTRVIQR